MFIERWMDKENMIHISYIKWNITQPQNRWINVIYSNIGFTDNSVGKESICNAGDPSSISGSGRSSGEVIGYLFQVFWGFSCGSASKESGRNAGDLGLIPELGRSPGEGKGYPRQYSGLENSMNCTVHGVAKSQTRPSDPYFHFSHRTWMDPRIIIPSEVSQRKTNVMISLICGI